MSNLDTALLHILSEDSEIIPYRKSLRQIAGSVTATILLQQMIHRSKLSNWQPFYKFKEPCSHELYRNGDSWTEELGFSRSEFDAALKRLGKKITKGQSKKLAEESNEHLILYWTDASRVTWYSLNVALLGKALNTLYLVNTDIDVSRKSRKPALPVTEITSEITSESSTENHHLSCIDACINEEPQNQDDDDGLTQSADLDVGFLKAEETQTEKNIVSAGFEAIAERPATSHEMAVLEKAIDLGLEQKLMETIMARWDSIKNHRDVGGYAEKVLATLEAEQDIVGVPSVVIGDGAIPEPIEELEIAEPEPSEEQAFWNEALKSLKYDFVNNQRVYRHLEAAQVLELSHDAVKLGLPEQNAVCLLSHPGIASRIAKTVSAVAGRRLSAEWELCT